jgi:hypothetical protein
MTSVTCDTTPGSICFNTLIHNAFRHSDQTPIIDTMTTDSSSVKAPVGETEDGITVLRLKIDQIEIGGEQLTRVPFEYPKDRGSAGRVAGAPLGGALVGVALA